MLDENSLLAGWNIGSKGSLYEPTLKVLCFQRLLRKHVLRSLGSIRGRH